MPHMNKAVRVGLLGLRADGTFFFGIYGWLPPTESMSAAVRQCLSELSIALTRARQFRRLRMFRIMDGLWINGGLRGFNRKMF